MTHLALLRFLHVVVVPVSIKPGADDLEVVDDVEREVVTALALRLPTQRRGWLLVQKEAVEAAVPSRHHVADLHLLA